MQENFALQYQAFAAEMLESCGLFDVAEVKIRS